MMTEEEIDQDRDQRPKPSFVHLRREFIRLTESRISEGAELTRAGLLRQFERVQVIEERLARGEPALPGNRLLAEGCADLALNWFLARRRAVTSGDVNQVSLEGVTEVKEELARMSEEDARTPAGRALIREWWYLDPGYGAEAAVDVLRKIVEKTGA